MILSLRTTSYTAAVFVALLLGFLLLLGSRQYRSHKEYKSIIEQNEKIIFQFATIREHITESLLENRPQQLNSITNDIEKLNTNITHILQQPIIPDEYRISFAGQVDFAGIILLLRSIGSGDLAQAKIRQLNQEIRILGERLMIFDRVIVDHVKRKLVGFQNFVIGLLAVVLFIVIYILLFWHSRIAMPLISLVKQTKEASSGKRSTITVRGKSGEVAELAGSFQNLLARQNRTSSELVQYNRVLEMVHNVSRSVWQVQTREAVFAEACRGVLSNSDYVLAWIGVPGDNNRIEPVVVDGSTTMSRQEQDECMNALLTAAAENPEKYDGARGALVQKSPVIQSNIVAGLPRGPFKNTPFANGKADCIALPLVHDQQVLGVLNIYSIAPLNYPNEEVELLQGMCREIVFAIFALDANNTSKTLAHLQAARNEIFINSPDLILVIQADGTVVEANPAAENKLNSTVGKLIGTNIHDLFHHASHSSLPFLEASGADSEKISLELECGGIDYLVRISPLKGHDKDDKIYLLIARDISEQKAHKTETIKASKLAALGELSVGVANEINNLTNGLINYTQILSEEIEEDPENNNLAKELLQNVMQEGERISQIVQQLLFFNGNNSHAKEAVKLNKIVEDSLALTKHQFRYDAIDVALRFPDIVPSVKVNVQEMQHIFLNLLSNARYALNQRYPGHHAQKRIEIKGEISALNGQQRFKVVCTDFGTGIQPNILTKVFKPFFSTKPEGIGTGLGLSICRTILEENNGSLEIESALNDHTSIIMELPVAA
jgi:PAS domain S-box-containing protein